VWSLYAELLARTGPLPTLVEWDSDVPAYRGAARRGAQGAGAHRSAPRRAHAEELRMSCLEEQRAVCAWLETARGAPGRRRAGALAVHRNTFVGTLVEALAESFPGDARTRGRGLLRRDGGRAVLAEPPRRRC
jgi:hypothetical protein